MLITGLWALFSLPKPLLAQEPVLSPISDPKVNSPKEALRLKIFADAPSKPSCRALNVHPRGGLKELDAGLDQVLQQLVQNIRKKEAKELLPLFHPRLNVGLGTVEEMYAKLESVNKSPFDISVFRLWAFNTVDGSPDALICPDEGLAASPLYGYPLQFGVWLQVMGQAELGRIYLGLVPSSGRWYIGAFHTQQWTHNSKDASAWAEEALQAAKQGYKEAAYIKFDMAAKLLDTGSFLDIGLRQDILKAKEAQMSKETWENTLKSALKDWDVQHVTTLFVLDGAGILVKIMTPKELSLEDLKKNCVKLAENLITLPWTQPLGGLRCSFILPRENPMREGILGGMYQPFSELRKTSLGKK